MVKVGITGGIGSGKTTVCEVWEDLGAVVVYADSIAKKLMVENESVKEQILTEFGNKAYLSDGTLNRAFLAEEAFNKSRVEDLNKIVHPAVTEKIKELSERAESQGADMFVEEAALLLDKGRPAFFDFIVLVTAPQEKRLKWVKERDRMSANEIHARMNRQKNFIELMPLCDFIINNDSSLVRLKEKAADVYRQILKLHKPGID